MGESLQRRADPRAVDSVMRAVDLAEERMGEAVGVEDMAAAACYSPYYFSRLFVQATGHAPYDYLMRRRVAAAAEEVAGGSRSLTDIALDHGFEVPDSFARAFRRCFGLIPSEARRSGSYPRRIARTKIERRYVEAMLESPRSPPECLVEEDRALAGTWLEGSEGEALAALATSGRRALVERDSSLRAGRVFIGAAAAAEGVPGGGLPAFPSAATLLPGGRRARFPVDGGLERFGFVLEYAYRTWLPLSGETCASPYDIVDSGEGGTMALSLVLGIPVPSH
jgi:AraC-like DNA-binding protein